MEQSGAGGNGFMDGEAAISCGGAAVYSRRLVAGSPLSGGQMESIAALCDTFFPSVNISGNTSGDCVAAYYLTSASMAGTPQGVAEMITQRLQHPKLQRIRLALWLLSTWFGTFILCGRRSLSSHFPFFQRFSKVRPEKREEIVQTWSASFFSPIRMLFTAMKMLTLLVFFTQVDDNGKNPSWKAIGYCGPDPEFMGTLDRKTRTAKQTGFRKPEYQENSNPVPEEPIYGPLNDSLIHLNKNPRQPVVETLRRSGFPATILDRKTTPSSPSLIVKCDAVVVGSGSGGSVVAGVLAKAGYKVLVLEKGNYFARANLSLLEGKTMNQMYMGKGLLATDDVGVVILAGETVGGGSTVNWSASIPTPKHVCREWCEDHGLELFESELYREAMEIVSERMGVQSEVENEGLNNEVLRRGCEELGFPVSNIPRNSAADHYCGWCSFGCKDGRKRGAAETWLVDAVDSGNGVILPACEAVKILTGKSKGKDRRIATGVVFVFQSDGGEETGIVESKVTIVAGGALSTPALLKRSGLKNRNIGRNLHLHPVAMAWGYFPETTSWPEPDKKSYEGGILTAMSTVVANFENSGYGAVIQTPSLHPGMFSVVTPWISGIDIKTRMCRFSRTAHMFALARDKGSGEVLSPNSIRYQMDHIDEENIQKGLEKVLRILTAAGAEEIGTNHRSGKRLRVREVSWNQFERFVKEESWRPLKDLAMPVCSAHQMGSCRMGAAARWSAVDQKAETWEVEGLFVADASLFPTALGVNPMVTVQAIAYCTAQSVLEVLRRKTITG